MKTVLCFGDSNTYGTPPMTGPDDARRFDEATRWPGVMRGALGAGWHVIEEGLPGRTTVRDDPIEGKNRNGRRYLVACLESHRPLDVVILALGTNDLKTRFGQPAEEIAAGAGLLLQDILATPNLGRPAPKLVLVAPPPVLVSGWLATMFRGADVTSQRFAAAYAAVAERLGATFVDAGRHVVSSPVDGVHWEAGEHGKLGKAMAGVVAGLLPASA